MWECLKTGWLLDQFNKTTVSLQKEIDEGSRLIIGVNAFKGPNGPISDMIKKCAYPVPPAEERKEAITRVKKLREQRDHKQVVDALTAMYEAEKNGENVIRAGVEACKAYATVGELVGILRLARDFPYDSFRVLPTPEYLKHLE